MDIVSDPDNEDKGTLGNYFGDNEIKQCINISSQPFSCSCYKVLIVDDEYMNIYALKTILKVSFNLDCDSA